VSEELAVIRSSLLVLCALALLSACNTVQGVGKDVSLAGGAVSDTAEDVQRRF
jgi:predicted small secreted protein